jgi:cytochrome b subunit of formate dehydrogenase
MRHIYSPSASLVYIFLIAAVLLILPLSGTAQTGEEYEPIDSDACVSCHETSKNNIEFSKEFEGSSHEGMECLECHINRGTIPHKDNQSFPVGCQGCRSCHEAESEDYIAHGVENVSQCDTTPQCFNCHGSHNVRPSTDPESKTNPLNLARTCGACHENLEITNQYGIHEEHPMRIYLQSAHAKAIEGGLIEAATCNDCHGSGGNSHKIFSISNRDSSIFHFNIPETCGQCHETETREYREGIHGVLAARGETESPVCTHCHGEHGILTHDNPLSPVSRARLAESTCTPCHESIVLTQKYGIEQIPEMSFIDSYHGLKTKSGDKTVANCASCHGVHKILPSSDPESSVNPANLPKTCGSCHSDITPEMASVPIHGFIQEATQSKASKIIRDIYILAIVVIIGMMFLHWLIDFIKQIILVMKKPQVRRMRVDEVVQHALLMTSFVVLVITGFALRYGNAWFASALFGWDSGFAARGIIHRVAAVIMIISTIWHTVFLFTKRGRQFVKDMLPKFHDLTHFLFRVLYNLGLSKKNPRFKRFSYVEKAEYWALVWGNVVMILSGLILWFDNQVVRFLPKIFIEISGVVHFYEAILATLAILIWHMYSTVFNPHVYPMNPSWLTGKMPADMFEHEHPDAEPDEE